MSFFKPHVSKYVRQINVIVNIFKTQILKKFPSFLNSIFSQTYIREGNCDNLNSLDSA